MSLWALLWTKVLRWNFKEQTFSEFHPILHTLIHDETMDCPKPFYNTLPPLDSIARSLHRITIGFTISAEKTWFHTRRAIIQSWVVKFHA